MSKQDTINQLKAMPAQITYFFKNKRTGQIFAAETMEAAETYERTTKRDGLVFEHLGRTDGQEYKRKSLVIWEKVEREIEKISAYEQDEKGNSYKKITDYKRYDEIKKNKKIALKNIFNQEVEKSKLDKTLPPSSKKMCIGEWGAGAAQRAQGFI